VKSVDVFLDRIEPNGIIAVTNNAEGFQLGIIFSELTKVRVDCSTELYPPPRTELWSTPINLRLIEAIIYRKPVDIVPSGWSAGLRLEGVGMEAISDALKEKGKYEFVHLRSKST
jgi:hypothetical protein